MSRKRLNWIYNEERQEFVTPAGTLSLLQVAAILADYAQCRIDLAGPWTGWRIRGNRLIPPGGSLRGPSITATNARQFTRWLASFEPQQAAFEFGSAPHPGRWEQQQAEPHASCRANTEDRRGTQHALPRSRGDSEEPRAPAALHEARPKAQVVDMARFRQRRQSGGGRS